MLQAGASLPSGLLRAASFAGFITGTITNGTNSKPAAGVEVILFRLQGGMQPVATTKTDATGHYKIDNAALGGAPMLLRAIYRGVNYHEPVMPDKTSIDIQVFEPTDKAGAFSVSAHAIILQPNGADLTVGEEFSIQNSTQPPMAFYRADGSFVFTLPDDAQLNDVSAVGGSGMPVVQSPVDKGKDQHAIAFPFRPGTSGVRISYHLPYTNDQATLHFTSPYAAERVAVFAPPTMKISADGFAPAGQDQGFSVFMRESVAANTPLAVKISGTAPPPAPDSGANAAPGGTGSTGGGDDSQNPAVNSRADSGAQAPVASVTTLPARMDDLKWILVAGFAVLFVLGLGLPVEAAGCAGRRCFRCGRRLRPARPLLCPRRNMTRPQLPSLPTTQRRSACGSRSTSRCGAASMN